MISMNSDTIQRLFRTEIQGMQQPAKMPDRKVRDLQVSHQDTTGMGFQGPSQGQSNQPQQVRTPIRTEQKYGRNDKILVQAPDGKQMEVKYKKLQNLLNLGYKQVS